MKKKNVIREALLEIEKVVHGSDNEFAPMDAQLIYNILESLYDEAKTVQRIS